MPQPKSVVVSQDLGAWHLPNKINVYVSHDLTFVKQHFESISEAFQRLTDCEFTFSMEKSTSAIIAEINNELSAEQYVLEISSQQVRIRAASIKGLAHATATLTTKHVYVSPSHAESRTWQPQNNQRDGWSDFFSSPTNRWRHCKSQLFPRLSC